MRQTQTLTVPLVQQPMWVESWQVEEGESLYAGQVILHLKTSEGARVEISAPQHAQTLLIHHVPQGKNLSYGEALVDIDICDHAECFGGLCVECGKDTTLLHFSDDVELGGGEARLGEHFEGEKSSSYHLVQGQPDLTANYNVAMNVEKEIMSNLRSSRKLSLVLDLDHTLVHATRTREDHTGDDIISFSLPKDPVPYYIKFRPFVKPFLQSLADIYEMQVYSMGTKHYVEKICNHLDPDGKYFADRKIARDTMPTTKGESGTNKSLAHLFPCDWSMVAVLDDREDVWASHQQNILRIKPYHYFQENEVNPRTGRKSEIAQENKEDEILSHNLSVLRCLHTIYYEMVDRNIEENIDVRPILSALNCTVLDGVRLVFSGIIPSNLPIRPEDTLIWSSAVRCGAIVDHKIDDATTHLVAAKDGTEKVESALGKSCNIHIVCLQWLTDSIDKWEKQNESAYLLLGNEKEADQSPKEKNFDFLSSSNIQYEMLLKGYRRIVENRMKEEETRRISNEYPRPVKRVRFNSEPESVEYTQPVILEINHGEDKNLMLRLIDSLEDAPDDL